MSESRNSGQSGDAVPYTVFCGLDVGKSDHHACALDPSGKRLHDKPLPNDETALAAVFTRLAEHGKVLVVVDQPASIGALAIATTVCASRVARIFAGSDLASRGDPPARRPR